MQDIRVKLYMLAAGLFDQPDDACSDFHFSLIAKLLHAAPQDWACRPVLEALERDIVEDAHSAALNAEHDRLFGEGGAVPPYAGHWLGRDAEEGLALMAGHGMAADLAIVPGHIISELEFLAYLVADDPVTRPAQRHFLQRHLGRWAPPFAAALRRAARLPRYRLAADFLDTLMVSEAALLTGAALRRSTDTLQAA
jgi:TorA maturation chaperone TorD